MTPSGTVTRRFILQGIGAAAVTSRFNMALASTGDFPPQTAIDNDPLRPRYHLMPERGWMNDPCGPVFWKGKYHMFFQYNPGASVWGDMHWAHAVSPDMVHWTHRPVALAPTPGGADAEGVFTGTMVIDKGVPTILYTGIQHCPPDQATLWASNPPTKETQNLATPAPGSEISLDNWTKLPKPVIAAPPDGMKVTGFRDPTPWKEADGWYMLLASGQKNIGGNVLLYKSADLRQWEYKGIFAEGKPTGKQTDDTVDSGETWECPDFFPLGGKHVLIHSTGTPTGRKTLWQVGTLDKSTMKWTPEKEGVLNHGPYYAPKSQLDADGNRILWGWIEETRPRDEFARAGWAGCMSLPRLLTLENGELRFAPARQCETLRTLGKSGAPALTFPAQAEFILTLKRGTGQAIQNTLLPGLRFASGPDLQWNGKTVELTSPLPDALELRIYSDHSVLELFLGSQAVLTYRPTATDRATLTLPSEWKMSQMKLHDLSSI